MSSLIEIFLCPSRTCNLDEFNFLLVVVAHVFIMTKNDTMHLKLVLIGPSHHFWGSYLGRLLTTQRCDIFQFLMYFKNFIVIIFYTSFEKLTFECKIFAHIFKDLLVVNDTMSCCKKMSIRYESGPTVMSPPIVRNIEFSKTCHPRPMTYTVFHIIIFRSGNKC